VASRGIWGTMVVDNFDVVGVGVEHVRGVVARVVAGALTGLAVAPVSGRDRITVEVFAKLEVNSRVDLTRLATERDSEPAMSHARVGTAGLSDFSRRGDS
jgi:hypothetical protein